MMKKSLLALLLALNTLAPAAETTIEVPTIVEKMPEETIPTKPQETKKNNLIRLASRCALLFVIKNALNRYLSYKGFTFNAANYAMHGATFGIDTYQPSLDSSKAAEIAEWLSKEISVVKGDKNKGDAEFSLSLETLSPGKVLCKAISRKKLFLPKNNIIRKFMDDEVVSTLMPLIESASKFKVSEDTNVSWQLKIPYNFTQLDTVQPIVRTAIGRKAGEWAELLLIGLSTSPSCPQALNKFIETEEGFALAKNLLGQVIEDSIASVVYGN